MKTEAIEMAHRRDLATVYLVFWIRLAQWGFRIKAKVKSIEVAGVSLKEGVITSQGGDAIA